MKRLAVFIVGLLVGGLLSWGFLSLRPLPQPEPSQKPYEVTVTEEAPVAATVEVVETPAPAVEETAVEVIEVAAPGSRPAVTTPAPSLDEALLNIDLAEALSGRITNATQTYKVQPGDSLFKIAKRQKTTITLLKKVNKLDSDLIRIGQVLHIVQPDFNVWVDKSDNLLLLKYGQDPLKLYRCSTGKGGITPTGTFTIVSRLKDPAWKGVVPSGDPENPLGSRWLGFDLPEYGIHGTNEPELIGQPVTRGCVRLANADVEELFDLLPQGTQVDVVE